MPSATEVAQLLSTAFDKKKSVLLEDAVLETLGRLGVSEYDAADVVDTRYLSVIRRYLESQQPEKLPFDLSITKPDRLIGKARPRLSDTLETKGLRSRLDLLEPVAAALETLGDTEFEHVTAAVLLRAGAIDAQVTEPGDDGGVDVFGRIPVLVGSPDIPAGLVRTTLEVQPVLFLGQAKRYSVSAIDRPELQKFAGQVRDCLAKYRGMSKKPSHRVPESYYEENETCLTFFVTTATFGKGARDYARSVNMILADGQLLAELFVYWGFGTTKVVDIDSVAVAEWVLSLQAASPFVPPSKESSDAG